MKFESTIVLTKKQNEIILRMVDSKEAQLLINSMVEIAEMSPYILMSPENFKNRNVEDEKKWIDEYNTDLRSILIIAQAKDKIVGILDFKAHKNPKSCHRGNLGISLHHTVRGEGLGELLFKKLISEVKKIDGLMFIDLSVMGVNLQAYHLYKKMGFVEVGRKPKAFKLPEGNYCDDVQMLLQI